jgi:bzd-type benzoyl-CoA reductase Q subunit
MHIYEVNEMTQDYWQWPESRWTAPDIDWKQAGVITAGVDVGAVSSQAAVMYNNRLYCYASIYTGPDSGGSANRVMEKALEGTGLTVKEIRYTVATGYGRKNVSFAQQTVNDIACHVKGARFIYGPRVRTIVDMGGLGAKVMKCTEQGRMTEFYVNDRCAAGMGRGIELLSRLMHVPLVKMGELSLTVEKDPEPVSTTCYLFANTEAMGQFREGLKESEILAAYLFAVAYRLFTLAGRVKVEKELALTGGLARNAGVVKRLERELGITAPVPAFDPQLAGAIGAALLAGAHLRKPLKAMAGVI